MPDSFSLIPHWPAVDPGIEAPPFVPESVAIAPESGAMDPGGYTVAEVLAHAEAHPEEVARLLEAELNGKGRPTLTAGLTAMLPEDMAVFDAGDVPEQPDEVEAPPLVDEPEATT